MRKNRGLQAEGGLLLFTSLLLTCAVVLVFLGRTRDGLPANSININKLAADQFGPIFKLEPALADELVKFREARHGFEYVAQLTSATVFPQSNERQEIAKRLKDNLIDPNVETAESLKTRLSISSAAAERIIQYRDRLSTNKFAKPEQILKVPIIESSQIRFLGNRLIVRHPIQVFTQFFGWIVFVFVLTFGTAVFVGKKSPKGDPLIFSLSVALAIVGAVTLFSVKDPIRDTLVSTHHLKGVVMGLVAFAIAATIPAHVRRGWKRLHYVFALASVISLAALKLIGHGPEGVNLSIFGIQPVEIIKIFLVLFIAGYLTDKGDLMADAISKWSPAIIKKKFSKFGISVPRWQDVGPILGMYAATLLLFFVIRDMGPALVLFSTFVLTFYAITGRSAVPMLGLLMMFGGEAITYLLHMGVMPVRIDMWLGPWHNGHPFGMQLGQSIWGMASGGLFGSGLGLGSPSDMPRSGSDLIYSSVTEELGAFGALFVMIVFLLIAFRGLKIARQTDNSFDRVLAIGISCLLTCQVFFIASGVTGLLPLTGISLPFLAYGNSSLIVSFFLTGLLRGISSRGATHEVIPVRPLFVKTTRNLATTFACGLVLLIGIGRGIWIQGVQADSFAGATISTPDADGQIRPKVNPRLTRIERIIPRGSVYDRNGIPLATSRFDEISAALGNNQELVQAAYQKGRYYPCGSDFAHILGLVDNQVGALAGVERDYQHEMRGFKNYSELVADYRWKDLPSFMQRIMTGSGERRGADVHLALDAKLQALAFKSLKSKMKVGVGGGDSGALVVLDPVSGDVLAAASWPTFDPNKIRANEFEAILKDEDKRHAALDRAFLGIYPPGSTFKIPLATIALDNQIDPGFTCEHVLKNVTWVWGGEVFARKSIADDQHDPPHGALRMMEAMKVSCNLYFANVALKLGADRYYHGLTDKQSWGFSHIRPIKEFAASLPVNGFGQGAILVTPIEMARVASAVGGGGSMMKARIISEVRTTDGKSVSKILPETLSKPLSPETANLLRTMMEGVVKSGTARGVFDKLNSRIA
ncbi:MAG: FtsW/RodA/SpoVE family cell cycle protein, partial [Chthonomonadales bacterium]